MFRLAVLVAFVVVGLLALLGTSPAHAGGFAVANGHCGANVAVLGVQSYGAVAVVPQAVAVHQLQFIAANHHANQAAFVARFRGQRQAADNINVQVNERRRGALGRFFGGRNATSIRVQVR